MYLLFLIFIHYKFLSSCLRLLLIYCHLALQHIFKSILLFIPITQGIYRIITFHLLELSSVYKHSDIVVLVYGIHYPLKLKQ